MNELREQLLGRMIRIYGFEHGLVVDFAKVLEAWPEGEQYDKCLATIVECHEKSPLIEDEE
jgi:hypothetical protein